MIDFQKLKRNGWELFQQPTYMEVIPQDDNKEHLAGDECWCKPKVEKIEDGNPPLLISHNALDKRG